MKNNGILHIGNLSCAGFAGYFTRKSFEGNDLFSYTIKKCALLFLNRTATTVPPITLDTLPVSIKGLSKEKEGRVVEIMKYGFPSLENVHYLDDYVLAYDNRTRVASWVLEHITADSIRKRSGVDRSNSIFEEDMSIHEYFRAKNSDYMESGFDRGHLAAAGNHRTSQKILDQTFLLCNIAPQVGIGFNRDAWMELERYVRRLTETYPDVYICTGPLYLPKEEENGKLYIKYEVIGDTHVAVPTDFFKLVLMVYKDRTFYLEAYIMPNQYIPDNTPLQTFMVPPEVIERSSGLIFFNKLSKKTIMKINGKCGCLIGEEPPDL